MDHGDRMVLAAGAIVAIFLVVQLGALAFIEPALEQGLQETEDGGDASLSLAFVVAILFATAAMLALMNYGGTAVLRGGIILASMYISFFVFSVFIPDILTPTVLGMTVDVLALGTALGLGVALYVYPEWYVIDAAGIVMGIGAAGLFGINFGIFPVIVLLVILAIYDAISVYGTEHMLTLASGVMEMRVPVVLVVPLSLSYSFLEEGGPDQLSNTDEPNPAGENEQTDRRPGDGTLTETATGEPAPEADQDETAPAPICATHLQEMDPEAIATVDPEQVSELDEEALENLDDEQREALANALPNRNAMFIGLGDAIIPAVLVASVAVFVETETTVSLLWLSTPLPAVTAMVGTIAGLVVLLWMVSKGRAHAGLPLLNSGAIGGYLVGALASGMSLAEALAVPWL